MRFKVDMVRVESYSRVGVRYYLYQVQVYMVEKEVWDLLNSKSFKDKDEALVLVNKWQDFIREHRKLKHRCTAS